MNWYALEVSSQKTFEVRDALKADRIEAYTPWFFEKKKTRHGTSVKYVKVPMPLMPGYVFVQLPSPPDRTILDVDHVHRAVAFGGPPIEIPERAMRRVMDISKEDVDKAVASTRLRSGTRVEVAEGPFSGYSGVVESIRGERALVIFNMIFASMVEVPTDILDVA